jgi:peptide-methionine (R)-S-oxide reductase
MKTCKLAILFLSVALVAWSCNRSSVDSQSKDDKATAEAAQESGSDEESEGQGGPRQVSTAGKSDLEDGLDMSEVPEEKVEPEMQLSEEEWREKLTAKEFKILRESGTERAFSGELLKNKTEGLYVCAGCGKPLFSSEHKFKSGTGWPSYYTKAEGSTAGEVIDRSLGMERVEIYCKHCGGHLGHVFRDGPEPTGLRYCINSVAMEFEQKDMDGDGEIFRKKQ